MLKDFVESIIKGIFSGLSGADPKPKKPQKTLNLDGGLWGDRFRIGDKFRPDRRPRADDEGDK
jgi:hypothetical protein